MPPGETRKRRRSARTQVKKNMSGMTAKKETVKKKKKKQQPWDGRLGMRSRQIRTEDYFAAKTNKQTLNVASSMHAYIML